MCVQGPACVAADCGAVARASWSLSPNHPTPYRAHQLMISNGGVAFSSLCLNTTMLVSTLALHIASGTIVITSSTTAFVTALTAQDLFDIYNANVIGSP